MNWGQTKYSINIGGGESILLSFFFFFFGIINFPFDQA